MDRVERGFLRKKTPRSLAYIFYYFSWVKFVNLLPSSSSYFRYLLTLSSNSNFLKSFGYRKCVNSVQLLIGGESRAELSAF